MESIEEGRDKMGRKEGRIDRKKGRQKDFRKTERKKTIKAHL